MDEIEEKVNNIILNILRKKDKAFTHYEYFKKQEYIRKEYKNIKNTFMTELLTKKNSCNMGSGFFILDNCSFSFLYPYDEVLLVVQGNLKVYINDDVLELTAGDVFFAKKDVEVLFKTDSFTEWFYVTYPIE